MRSLHLIKLQYEVNLLWFDGLYTVIGLDYWTKLFFFLLSFKHIFGQLVVVIATFNIQVDLSTL